MSFAEVLKVVIGTLRAHKLRTFLTLLGVIIGVTTVITVVSIIQGMNRYVVSTITHAGSNVFRIDRFGLITSHEEWIEAMRRKDLTLQDMESVNEKCPLCSEVGAFSIMPSFLSERFIDASAGRKSIEDPQVFGVTANFGDLENREIIEGRYLTASEVDHSTFSAVIGYEIAKNLFPKLEAVGKRITINRKHFRVIGVLKKYGNIFGENQDNRIEIPISSFHKLFGRQEPLFINVKVADANKMNEAQDQARVVLRSRHHKRYEDKDDFEILTTDNLVSLWKAFTAGAFAAMIGISSIALVVGGIVIMNIMLVSVVERTSEIGLRKALGARTKDIRRQFLLESVLIAAAGGIIGVFLGAGAAWIISKLSPMPASVEPGPVIAGLVLASVVGLVSGMWPAMKASRLDPIVALRTE
jgi:putative ABC transport system permease protein